MSQLYRPLPCQFVHRRRRRSTCRPLAPISLPIALLLGPRVWSCTTASVFVLPACVSRDYAVRRHACMSCGHRRMVCWRALHFVCACRRVLSRDCSCSVAVCARSVIVRRGWRDGSANAIRATRCRRFPRIEVAVHTMSTPPREPCIYAPPTAIMSRLL